LPATLLIGPHQTYHFGEILTTASAPTPGPSLRERRRSSWLLFSLFGRSPSEFGVWFGCNKLNIWNFLEFRANSPFSFTNRRWQDVLTRLFCEVLDFRFFPEPPPQFFWDSGRLKLNPQLMPHCLTLTAHGKHIQRSVSTMIMASESISLRNQLASTINRHRCLENITADLLCELFQGRRWWCCYHLC
jgi:hypothetical protein